MTFLDLGLKTQDHFTQQDVITEDLSCDIKAVLTVLLDKMCGWHQRFLLCLRKWIWRSPVNSVAAALYRRLRCTGTLFHVQCIDVQFLSAVQFYLIVQLNFISVFFPWHSMFMAVLCICTGGCQSHPPWRKGWTSKIYILLFSWFLPMAFYFQRFPGKQLVNDWVDVKAVLTVLLDNINAEVPAFLISFSSRCGPWQSFIWVRQLRIISHSKMLSLKI